LILVDTSVWIDVLRDRQGDLVAAFRDRIGLEICLLCRFTQLELLQGAKNENEWENLDEYLSSQYYLEVSEITWREAARIYFELRRKGITINSPVDCCIAQIAIESGALLMHRDEDFERIAQIRPLLSERFDPNFSKFT
jgi:predicted nucleic acid-binding protein